MTRLASRLAAGLLLFLLSACSMPQPFRHTERNPLLTIGSRAGAMVRPVAGGPEWMAEAMADALRTNDVAAAVGIGNAASLVVEGAIAPHGEFSLLTWRVLDPKGQVVASHTQPLQAADVGEAEVLQRLIGAAAPVLANALAGPDEPRAAGPVVALRPVTGAPADGNEALTRAMNDTLRRAGFVMGGENAELVVNGTVLITPGPPGHDHVELVWTVMRPGSALPVGTIRQANDLPKGTVQVSWRPVAGDIARAAVEGLGEMVRRFRTKR